nr:hypothetical protein [uncultured Peptostreptococcus sp.]
MELNYSLKGEERKKLVHAIEHLTLEKAKYLGMPSAAYEVGEFIVSKKELLHQRPQNALFG